MSNKYSHAVIAGLIFATTLGSTVYADPPPWAGGGKHGKGGRDDNRNYDQRGGNQGGLSITIRFGDPERRAVQDYYGGQNFGGHCPPGLAKKNNGCMPPGQAKQWRRGSPLPSGLEIYDLPRDLTMRLPVPPSGQRYVRIAGDILLIAIGTNMVLDAIEDLGR